MATTFKNILRRLETGRARLLPRARRGRPVLGGFPAEAQQSVNGNESVWVKLSNRLADYVDTMTLIRAGSNPAFVRRLTRHSTERPYLRVWIAPALPAATAAKRTRRTRTTSTRG